MPRLPLNECPLFFFDSETGGLEPTRNDMLEVACIVTDPTGRDVREEFSAKVFPEKPVEPAAAAINGYNAEKWATEAIPIGQAMVKMLMMAKNCIFVAHNTPFDWAFFSMAMARRAQRWPGDYHRIDTCALAWPMLIAGRVENVKLATMAKYYEIDPGLAHSALSDVRTCRSLYLKLMAEYAPFLGAK